MTIKNVTTLCAAAIVLATAGFVGSRPSHKSPPTMRATVLANLDALLGKESNSEQNKGSLDTNYNRDAKNCVFYVGVGSSLKIFGVGVINADAKGMMSIPERVICSANGDQTCSPVECIDVLREVMRNAEKQ